MAGWYFKKGKPKKVFPAKYNNRPRVRSSTQTPLARAISESKAPGAKEGGAAVLYRDHIKSGGGVFHKYTESHPRFKQQETSPITIFGEYATTPRSKRPPIVNAIYDRIEVKLEQMNWRRQAFKYWNHIVPVDETFRKLFYFFSGTEGFFVERDYIRNRIRMSRDYESSTARVLIKREQWERIAWIQVEATPPCDPPD
jgi:hypothetical protein